MLTMNQWQVPQPHGAAAKLGFEGEHQVHTLQIAADVLGDWLYVLELQFADGSGDILTLTPQDNLLVTPLTRTTLRCGGQCTAQIRGTMEDENGEILVQKSNLFTLDILTSIAVSDSFPTVLPSEFLEIETAIAAAHQQVLDAAATVDTLTDGLDERLVVIEEGIASIEQGVEDAQTALISAQSALQSATDAVAFVEENTDAITQTGAQVGEIYADVQQIAQAVEENATLAQSSADTALLAQQSATAAQVETAAYAQTATEQAQIATTQAQEATEHAALASVDADRAQAAADRADSIVGGDFIPNSDRGVAGGVATLDDGGQVPSAQLPAMDYDAQGSAAQALSDAKQYTDAQIATIPTPDVSGQIDTHNSDATAHTDIRASIPAVSDWALADSKPTYTAAEVGADAQGSAAQALDDAKQYTDAQVAEIPTPDVSGQINTHNSNAAAHADIRALIPAVSDWAQADSKPTYTATEVGAAATTHYHSASSITSGTLAITRGGTGVTSMTGTDYTTNRPRGMTIQSSKPSSIVNGSLVAVPDNGLYAGYGGTVRQIASMGDSGDFELYQTVSSTGTITIPACKEIFIFEPPDSDGEMCYMRPYDVTLGSSFSMDLTAYERDIRFAWIHIYNEGNILILDVGLNRFRLNDADINYVPCAAIPNLYLEDITTQITYISGASIYIRE